MDTKPHELIHALEADHALPTEGYERLIAECDAALAAQIDIGAVDRAPTAIV